MKNRRTRVALCVICCSALLTVAPLAQKPLPKADDWPVRNAVIGPDSMIEISAGSHYQAQAMYPVPDGPLFPLKAGVSWSIESGVKGISIDKAGMITVDVNVPHGATATLHANVESGRRMLAAKIYVFRPEENPLIGAWRIDTQVACGESHEMKATTARPLSLRGNHWKFHVSQQFWVGKEHNIAAGVRLAGAYELDSKASRVKLLPTWPKKPASNWSYLIKDGGKTLILQPLEAQDDLEPGCGYILAK